MASNRRTLPALLLLPALWPVTAFSDGQTSVQRAVDIAQAMYGKDYCTAQPDAVPPEIHAISWKPSWLGDDDPETVTTLIGITCNLAAYNAVSLWFAEDDMNGLRPLAFAVPTLNVIYEDAEFTKVETILTEGFSTERELVNATFAADANSLSSYNKSRGLGDAFTVGEWVFADGAFVLKRFEVDATFDEEINPVTVYDADGTGPR